RNANAGCRKSQAKAPKTSAPIASSARLAAMAFNCLGSSHMRAPQDRETQIGKRNARLLRCHRHQRMSGHSGRRVDFEKRIRAVGAQDDVEASPAASAADDTRGQ